MASEIWTLMNLSGILVTSSRIKKNPEGSRIYIERNTAGSC